MGARIVRSTADYVAIKLAVDEDWKLNSSTQKKSGLVVVLVLFIIFGAPYRYMRLLSDFVHYIPYLIEVVFAAWVVIGVFQLKIRNLNQLDIIFAVVLCSTCLSFVALSLQYGVKSQLTFFATYISPLFVYYFVKNKAAVDFALIDKSLRVFAVLGAGLLIFEFITVNYTTYRALSFQAYWDEVGVTGYHSSQTVYAFIGSMTRPWGPMAMPQASGSLFASLFTYFLAKRLVLAKGNKSPDHSDVRCNWFYLLICLTSVYISGSRTAYVVVILMILLVYRHHIFKRNGPLIFIVLAVLAVVMMNVFIFVSTPSMVGFLPVIQATVDGLTVDSIERFYQLVFGQGLNTIPGKPIVGVSEVHILNHLFTGGLLTYLSMGVMSMYLFYGIKQGVARYCEDHQMNDLSRPFLLYIFSSILGSLHYDALFRYPNNVIALAMIGCLSRYYSYNKHQERLKTKPLSPQGSLEQGHQAQ